MLYVADVFGIDMEVVNFAVEHKDRVSQVLFEEYAAGRTPNPRVVQRRN